MVHVIASVSVQEGRKEEFLDIFKANVPKVRQERGCIEYAPCVDLPAGLPSQDLEGQVVTVVEKWSSLEDLQAHLAAPHMQEYKERVKDMVLATSIKVLQEV
jgi:quinol monooxygenase YgiN